MIAFLDDHPLVQFPDGRTVAFERCWLEDCLIQAAARAGYEQWWLAGHVTESVSLYLKTEFSQPVLPIYGLEKAVKSVLQSIGYADVAGEYQTLPPPVRVCLLEVARKAGEGFELLFFQILRKRLQEAVASGTRQIECDRLQECVKALRRAKHWRRDCRGLQSEIVEFVREQVQREAPTPANLQLQLT